MIAVTAKHVLAWVVIVAVMLVLVAVVLLRHQPRRLMRVVAAGFGTLVALYLVGRGIAEFFVVHYADAASYRSSWGGPSLVGVFLVHSGPGAAIVIGLVGYLLHWWPRSRRAASAVHGREPGGTPPARLASK